METRRQRRRGGKAAQAVSSDPPVRLPSSASECTAESEEESEMELADLGATGVRDRGPPLPLPYQGMLMRRHPQELGQEQKGLMQRHRLPLSVWLKDGWLPPERT